MNTSRTAAAMAEDLASLPDDELAALAERFRELLGVRAAAADEELLKVPEAAAYLRCSPQRIYDLRSQKLIKPTLDGKRTLYRRNELDRYLREQGGGA